MQRNDLRFMNGITKSLTVLDAQCSRFATQHAVAQAQLFSAQGGMAGYLRL
ncbi:MAG: hypothetical protein IPN06_08435 [Burkholderiales bacterium]|nr:hypothetical protein [Burkholderiales bacterium]